MALLRCGTMCAITLKEHAVMTNSCPVLHQFCGLIFVDQMPTTKSMTFYTP